MSDSRRRSQRDQLDAIVKMLHGGDHEQALVAAGEACRQWPGSIDCQVLLGRALCRNGRSAESLQLARQLIGRQSLAPGPRMLAVEALLQSGDHREALVALREAREVLPDSHPALLQEMAQSFVVLGQHREAEACHARARTLTPDNPEAIYNHATSLIALGRLEDAERSLDRLIELAPDDADAWYNRATLRRQTAERNHVDQIRQQIARTPPRDPARVPLNFALAKELEDLGRHEESFAALDRGAAARRAQLSYCVGSDVSTMAMIQKTFDRRWLASAASGHSDSRPVFIVGLPRSGTTLVDRILSSHSQVDSRGETTDLAMSIVRLAGPAGSKSELVKRASKIDPVTLGQRYCAALPAGSSQRQSDKTPANFLYLGLVAAALPQARIIHVRRNPMDTCYAIYKTLFRMAYPFSYSLTDLGTYWLAWNDLMAHWRELLPAERYLEVDYEDLVANQERVSRRIVDHAGLDWQPACLSFERNQQPSLTASAAQVRQPIYTSSVGLWKRYQRQLVPLQRLFTESGIDIDATQEQD